jgi:hypothetical protein
VTHPSAIPVFVRLFRSAASIDIDKNDVRRFRDFVDEQIDDLAIAGRNSAKWNARDVISPQDLPITKAFRNECVNSTSSGRPKKSASFCASRCGGHRPR